MITSRAMLGDLLDAAQAAAEAAASSAVDKAAAAAVDAAEKAVGGGSWDASATAVATVPGSNPPAPSAPRPWANLSGQRVRGTAMRAPVIPPLRSAARDAASFTALSVGDFPNEAIYAIVAALIAAGAYVVWKRTRR